MNLMHCYVCGSRATKLRRVYDRWFGLCSSHGIKDLVELQWLNLE